MSEFAREDSRGRQRFVSDADVVIESDRDQDGSGDIIFRSGGLERARIKADGSGTGWPTVIGGIETSAAYRLASTGTTVTAYDKTGATVSSGSDGGAVFTAVLALVPATGAHISFRNDGNAFPWTTIPALPRALTGKLKISGNWATVRLSSGAPRMFDWNKVADYDTFQHIDIGEFVVDANSIGGKHHVVVGPWQNGSWQRKINLDDVHVHDIRITNAVVGTDSAVDFRIGVHIGGAASVLNDSLCTFTNCSVKRIWSDGCLQLVDVHGAPVGAEATANTYHDKIVVEDITHDLPSTPTSFNAGAHVMAGTKGTGGSITISRVRGKNSPDVGLEWDCWQVAKLDDIIIEDAYDYGFFHVNYNLPEDVEAQISTLQGCVARRRNLNDHGYGFGFGVDESGNLVASNRPGSIRFGPGCMYHRMTTSAGTSVQNEALDIYGSRRILGDFLAVVEMPAYSASSQVTPSAIRIRNPDTTVRTDVRLKAVVRCTGSNTGSGTIAWRSLLLRDGLLTGFDIDLESDVNISTNGNATLIHADIGSTSGTCTLSGRLSVKIPSGAGGNTPVGILFESGSFNSVPSAEEIVLERCNFAGLAAASTEVSFSGATTLRSRVRMTNNVHRTTLSSVAMSGQNFAASTFTTATANQYIGGYSARLHFATGTGAAITKIELSKDNSTFEQVYSQASGAMATDFFLPVDHGDYVRVTFATTQPTTTVFVNK